MRRSLTVATGSRSIASSRALAFVSRRPGRRYSSRKPEWLGVKRRITVGYAPDMSLSNARLEALQTLAAMRSGIDPTADRRARLRAAAAKTITIREWSERWLAEFVIPKLKPRTASDYKELLTRRILPAVGNLTVAEIDHGHIERLHLDLKSTPRRGNYAVTVLRALLNFAVRHGLRPNRRDQAIS
jgi:Phage integrase, N-terminal SAM-like domain/Arm DNA-binding domain